METLLPLIPILISLSSFFYTLAKDKSQQLAHLQDKVNKLQGDVLVLQTLLQRAEKQLDKLEQELQ